MCRGGVLFTTVATGFARRARVRGRHHDSNDRMIAWHDIRLLIGACPCDLGRRLRRSRRLGNDVGDAITNGREPRREHGRHLMRAEFGNAENDRRRGDSTAATPCHPLPAGAGSTAARAAAGHRDIARRTLGQVDNDSEREVRGDRFARLRLRALRRSSAFLDLVRSSLDRKRFDRQAVRCLRFADSPLLFAFGRRGIHCQFSLRCHPTIVLVIDERWRRLGLWRLALRLRRHGRCRFIFVRLDGFKAWRFASRFLRCGGDGAIDDLRRQRLRSAFCRKNLGRGRQLIVACCADFMIWLGKGAFCRRCLRLSNRQALRRRDRNDLHPLERLVIVDRRDTGRCRGVAGSPRTLSPRSRPRFAASRRLARPPAQPRLPNQMLRPREWA